MVSNIRFLALTPLLLFFLSGFLAAQQVSPSMVKAAMTYKFAQNLEWPQDTTLNYFTVGVLTNKKEVIDAFTATLNKVYIHQKPVKVKQFKKFSDFQDAQLIYLDDNFSADLNKLNQEIYSQPRLLVSDQATDQRKVMINFYSENDRLKFEINKANVINARLTIKPSLILLGGTEIDVAKLYKDSQENLEKEKEKVSQQQQELAKMQQEILEKKEEIDLQKNEINLQKAAIQRQQNEILIQQNKLTALNENVVQQQKILDEKVKVLDEQVNKINQQEHAILQQEKLMQRRNEELTAVTEQIENQQARLKEQKSALDAQNVTIEDQKSLIYVFITFLGLIVALAFFIYRSYQNQKKYNFELSEKNEEILHQQEEIAVQRDNLQKVNEHVMSSIQYANTIQKAILPATERIQNSFSDSFILYRPKDIVSGDFYWFSHLTKKEASTENEVSFIAAVDCTGHGVPGAFMSIIGSTLLNEIVNQKHIIDPATILDHLHKGVKAAMDKAEGVNTAGMDICLIRLEKGEGNETRILFSGAKRNLLFIRKDSSEIEQLKGDRKSIGSEAAAVHSFTTQELILKTGSTLYLSSDGYTDQNNSAREKLGTPKLLQLIKSSHHLPLAQQKDLFERVLDEHQQGTEQRDDITLIGVKI